MSGAQGILPGGCVRNTLLPKGELSIHPGLEQVAKKMSGSVDKYFDELVKSLKGETMPQEVADQVVGFASGLNIKEVDQLEVVSALRKRGLDEKQVLPVLAMVASQAALFPALNDKVLSNLLLGPILMDMFKF